MNLHKLGQTGLQVSPIGLGLAALGRPGYINLGHAQDLSAGRDVAAMEHHAHAVLDAAWACLLYTSPSPRDRTRSRMPSSA